MSRCRSGKKEQYEPLAYSAFLLLGRFRTWFAVAFARGPLWRSGILNRLELHGRPEQRVAFTSHDALHPIQLSARVASLAPLIGRQ